MKKFYYLCLAAGLTTLASCSSDDFLGGMFSQKTEGNGEISFGTYAPNMTRAELSGASAAEKLNKNFIVYGFKNIDAEAVDGSKDLKVFDTYNVNYTAGTANTTESNTNDWEYVGYDAHETSSADGPQSIKYWDYEANSGYVFSAVSGVGITATKINAAADGDALAYADATRTLTVNGTATVYDKGWKVEIPAGGSLSDLYASDRLPVAKSNYDQLVSLKFRAIASKVRFAMYEKVPGYEVHIDKFYYGSIGSWSNTTTNFAINGTFKTAKENDKTTLYVTYNDNTTAIENRPKVSYLDSDVATAQHGIFGANIQATSALGTSSDMATYDQEDKSYTMILPCDGSDLTLYVDYTLTSTDNSGETIHVKHASAKVPANFTQWKPNFAYTYLFKISDNTNGTTGNPGDPNDPTATPTDKTGLFPITFDAVVVTEDVDVQETITSVADPSITTYQSGVVVTANDEYKAGDIYFMNDTKDVSNYKVYEVNNLTTNLFETQATMSEEVVANYLKNFCVLTEVPTVDPAPAGIPLIDGTYIPTTADQAKKFVAEAGKVYAICDEATPTKHYKVVRVSGSVASAPSFTLSTSAANIQAIDGTATLTLEQDGVGVLGALPCFTVTSDNGNNALKIADGANAGEYTVSLDADAVHAGKANGTYTIEFGDKQVNIDVQLGYGLTLPALTMDAGDEFVNSGGVYLQVNICGSTKADAKKATVVNENAGVTVTPMSNYFKINVASDCVAGDKTITIDGQTLTLTVKNYRFAQSAVKLVKPYNNGVGTAMNLWDEQANALANVPASALTVSDPKLAVSDIATGQYSFGSTDGGVYTVTYKNTKAKCVVTVEEYAMNDASVKKSTGKATLTVTLNNGSYNASTSALKIYDSLDNDVTSNFTVTTNGKSITLSNVKSTLAAGTYTAKYTVGTTIVAQSTITVTE